MTELSERLDSFESRLRFMEDELHALRRLAQAQAQEAPPTRTTPYQELFRDQPQPAPVPEPQRSSTPVPVWEPERRPARAPRPPREPIDLSVLLGARALAWTGGAVTLLGIVFFFVLAVERGWIGPTARVTLGASVSAVVLGAALWLRRRFGDTYASLSAAGVGIAGFYATLLAATTLYDLVPPSASVVAAAGIAAVGGVIAWRWNSETLATLGLLGAILAPVAIAIQSDLMPLGVAFAGLVLAAATVVAVLRNWRGLHVAAVACAAPQALALTFDNPSNTVPVVFGIWLVLAAVPVWLALRTRLAYLPASLLLFSAVFGGWAAGVLFGGNTQGYVLLAVALAYGAGGTVLYRRDRDTASLLWALGLTLAAIGAASLVSGATLTIVWAAEAAILAWLAQRIKEPRFQLAAFAWLGLAFVHGIAIDARPKELFVENSIAWHAVSSAASLAIASALVGFWRFEWEDRAEGLLTRMFADLRESQPWIRRGGLALAGVTAVYAGSLAVVGLPSSWDWGHVLVAALWSSIAVLLVFTRLRVWGLALLGASVVLVVAYDLPFIDETQRSWSFAIVAGAAFVSAIVWELSFGEDLELAAIAALIASVGLAAASAAELLDNDPRAWVFLALAAGYGLTGVALLRRRRDFASALGIAALALAFPASVWLLDGTWLVLAWAATGAALAVLARYEERLEYGALAYLAFALVHTLVMEAQPNDVFVAHDHPGSGAPAALLVLAGLFVFTRVRAWLRTPLLWLCGALGLYAATLAILEASERAGGSIDTAFQRGHTAVSALWAVVGLVLLILGLKGNRALQAGGFVLFGISLAKLFLYDLANLSSVTRAFSFVAVGMLIMFGGFFYQRMAQAGRPKSSVTTGFTELDELLTDFVAGLRAVLGDAFTGAYLTGSFAIGDADVHSDVDWLVVTERALTDDEQQALNDLHAQLYARDTHWAQHLEGSYAPRAELRRPGPEQWLFLDNGATTLAWDRHCNTSVVRWTVRERPVVLAGPDPRELIDPVPADALRDEARPVLAEYAAWAHEPHAGHSSGMSRWKQPYVVLTLCRALRTIETGTVCSKREAGEWAKRSLDPEWRDLIQQALDDRPDPWARTKQDSTPVLVARTRAFADSLVA